VTKPRWNIVYKKSVRKDIKALSPEIRKIIQEVIEQKLFIDPLKYGTPLKGTLKKYFKCRVGQYRIVYEIQKNEIIVCIITIAHRKDVYQKLGYL
jgi:mRNA interferase RelE/StbE